MKTGVEETIAIRYMMRCLGVKVEITSLLCGDNLGVIQNSTIKASLLKKKHVAISYHKTCEASAAGIVHPIKTCGTIKYSDVLTKSQDLKTFKTITGSYMYGWWARWKWVRTSNKGSNGIMMVSPYVSPTYQLLGNRGGYTKTCTPVQSWKDSSAVDWGYPLQYMTATHFIPESESVLIFVDPHS